MIYGRDETIDYSISPKHWDTLTVTISADEKLVILFSYFSQSIGFDISCKVSPYETICMQFQSLFSRENNKIFKKCRLMNILPSMLRKVSP